MQCWDVFSFGSRKIKSQYTAPCFRDGKSFCLVWIDKYFQVQSKKQSYPFLNVINVIFGPIVTLIFVLTLRKEKTTTQCHQNELWHNHFCNNFSMLMFDIYYSFSICHISFLANRVSALCFKTLLNTLLNRFRCLKCFMFVYALSLSNSTFIQKVVVFNWK